MDPASAFGREGSASTGGRQPYSSSSGAFSHRVFNLCPVLSQLVDPLSSSIYDLMDRIKSSVQPAFVPHRGFSKQGTRRCMR